MLGDESMTKTRANSYCTDKSRNSRLVEVTDREMQNQIKDLVNERGQIFWLGGYNEVSWTSFSVEVWIEHIQF